MTRNNNNQGDNKNHYGTQSMNSELVNFGEVKDPESPFKLKNINTLEAGDEPINIIIK